MEDKSLMQSLCEDFSRINYSRWERRSPCARGRGGKAQRKVHTLPNIGTRRARWRGDPSRTSYPRDCVAGEPQEQSSTHPGAHGLQGSSLDSAWPSLAQVLGASCSVLCRHPWVVRPPPPPPPPDILAQLRKSADVKVLECLAETKKSVIKECRQRIQALETANERLAQETREMEEAAFREVKATLAQLQKHQRAQVLLEEFHGREMSEAIANEQRVETAMREDVFELECKVRKAEVQLEEARSKLRLLRVYRRKERPLQVVRQAQLQRQLHALQQQQKAEKAEEHRRHEERLARIAAQGALTLEGLLRRIAQEHLAELPHDLQTKSFQNTNLRKEIEMQEKEVVALCLLIPALQREVRQLAAWARKQCHAPPRFLPSDRKLTQDEEVELDIPRDVVLPF